MNDKQLFLMAALLVVSGDMVAGRGKPGKKWQRKQVKVAQEREWQRRRAESEASLESFRSSSDGRNSVETVEDKDPWMLCEGEFVNPNHSGVMPKTSRKALPKRAEKLQREADRQAEQAAAVFHQGRQ